MNLGEFLAFRKFFAPIAIQLIFWLGVIGVVVAALTQMFHGVMAFLGGIIVIVVGIVMVRIYCELLILLFRIYDELVAIRTGRPPTDVGFEVVPPRSPSAAPATIAVVPVVPVAASSIPPATPPMDR